MRSDEVAAFDALELRLRDALLELAGAYVHAGSRLTHARSTVEARTAPNLDQVDSLIAAARASTVIVRALFDQVPQS